jgi:hypothetical protein
MQFGSRSPLGKATTFTLGQNHPRELIHLQVRDLGHHAPVMDGHGRTPQIRSARYARTYPTD